MKNYIFLTVISWCIISSCNQSSNLPTLEFDIFDTGYCYQKVVDGRFIIENENEYQSVFQNFQLDTLQFPECRDSSAQTIDFDTHTLIGIRKCGSGCETYFDKKVMVDKTNEKYLFEVKVREEGFCEPWRCSMNWVLVPKLPEGYMVEFL